MSRYDIYEAMGKEVAFKLKTDLISGFCRDVKRKVLDNKIVFIVNDKPYEFTEPHKIEKEDNKLVFIYGSEQIDDLMEFCGEEYSVHWGEDVRKSIGREKTFFKSVIEIKE